MKYESIIFFNTFDVSAQIERIGDDMHLSSSSSFSCPGKAQEQQGPQVPLQGDLR